MEITNPTTQWRETAPPKKRSWNRPRFQKEWSKKINAVVCGLLRDYIGTKKEANEQRI